MIDPRRPLLAGACFLLAAGLLVTYDFGERGPHFAPAAAEAKTDRAGVYDLSRARILTKVVGHVRSHYVDPDRVRPKDMAVAALRAVQGQVPEVMVRVERDGQERPKSVEVAVGEVRRGFSLGRVGDLFELNWKLMDVFDFLQAHLPPTADLEDLEYTAVNGMLSTLDPHSVLATPRAYREMQLGTQGRFGGLGIVISMRDGVLTIMSVMDQTPAARAKLQSGDQVVQIGEESTINMPINEAVQRLRGEPDTDVTLWINRKGWTEPRAFTITREEIRVPAVDHAPLGDGIGYVRIRSFQGNTFDNLVEALDKLKAQPGGLTGLVMDLRDNPGGLLDQAIKVSDLFLSEGTIVTTVREFGKEREERHATRSGTESDVPIVLLINRGSASASEIVAGALKHNDRALVIGSTSFGKGSVQVLYQIDDAGLKLTIAQYLTPGDVSIQSVGIVPDVQIEHEALDAARLDLYPDEADDEGEAGLEKHLENGKAKASRPALTLRIVEEPEPAEEGAAEGGDEAPEGDAGEAPPSEGFTPDSLVTLAKEIVRTAPVTDRRRMLVQSAGFFGERQREEDGKLVAGLAALGVDWTRGKADKRPALRPTLEVVPVGGAAGTPARAGGKVKLVGRVTNAGTRDAWRVHAVVDSEIPGLRGRELVFGHVAPGQTREWSTEAELPRSLPMQADKLVMTLYADGEPLDAEAETFAVVEALPAPRFAWSAQVIDPEGNGDGLVQRGETVDVVVHVTNVGQGDADDVLVTIKNESGEGAFIETGRDRVGKLAVGASARAAFRVRVRPTLKSQDVQLELTVVDQGLRTWSEDALSLPVFPSEFPAAAAATGLVRLTGGPAPARAGAHQDTAAVAQVADGAVLPRLARAGEWVKVRLGAGEDAAEGWLPAGRLAEATGAPAFDGVTEAGRHEPPALVVAGAWLGDLVVGGETLDVTGAARFVGEARGRRYLYVFRNEDKVFFRSADRGAEAAGAPGDALPFDTTVNLEAGRNVLTFVAREGEDDVTRRTVVVYRR